jgi:hypothetical protein
MRAVSWVRAVLIEDIYRRMSTMFPESSGWLASADEYVGFAHLDSPFLMVLLQDHSCWCQRHYLILDAGYVDILSPRLPFSVSDTSVECSSVYFFMVITS